MNEKPDSQDIKRVKMVEFDILLQNTIEIGKSTESVKADWIKNIDDKFRRTIFTFHKISGFTLIFR